MSRTFLNQVSQVASSETYDDTLAPGPELELTGSESSVQDDLNALRSMIRTAMYGVSGSSHWYDAPPNSILGIDTGKLYTGYDTMSGTLNMGSNYIFNVLTPVNENDIASKVYVDTVTSTITVRASRTYARVTALCTAGSDLVSGSNLDNALPVFDSSTFDSNYDIFMNGQILRPGSDHDVYTGSVPSSLRLTYDAYVGDVISVVHYAAPGYISTGITIGSIAAVGGDTLITLLVNGSAVTDISSTFSPDDPLDFIVTYGGVDLPIIAYDNAANPSSPSMGDILLSGTWSPAPSVGDVVDVLPAGGGGGGGPGIYTIDAFNYDVGTNNTQFTLFKDGTPSTDNFTAPGTFTRTTSGVTLTLVTQSYDLQPYFIVSGQWIGLAVGDVITYASGS